MPWRPLPFNQDAAQLNLGHWVHGRYPSDGDNDRHSDDQTTHDDSAKHVTEQITERALYLALEKPEVAQHWNSQIDVLKTGERAASIHALVDVRDGVGHSNAMAKVNATRTLLDQGEAAAAAPRGTQQTAGLIIVINGATTPKVIEPPTIDVTPQQKMRDETNDGGR